MKRIVLCLVALTMLVVHLNAQTYFSDDFSNQALPNWTVSTISGNVSWAWDADGQSAGQAAGTFQAPGAANGCILLDSDGGGAAGSPEYSMITSKAIDCSGSTSVIFSFLEYYAKYQSDTGRVYVSNDSINWTLVHTASSGLATNQTTPNPKLVETNISSIAANDTIWIRFSWKGEYDYWWFVDDVNVFMPSTENAQADAVNAVFSNGCTLSNAEDVSIVIHNKGISPLSTVSASFQVDNGTVVTENVILPAAIGYDTTYEYTFVAKADLSAAGVHQITGWLDLAGDTLHGNDTATAFAISAAPIALTSPYTTSFEVPGAGNDISAYTWTSLDANNDGFTWNLSGSSANNGQVHFRYSWNDNGTTAANDWLFSPCLQVDASKAYKVDFWSEVGEDNSGLYPEKLEVKAGMDRTVAGMTQDVVDLGEMQNSTYEEHLTAFKPATSGIYYVGFHCYSDANEWFLDIDDVTISELAPPTANFTTAQTGTAVSVTDASSEMITDWTWYWGDGNISTGETPGAHVYAQPGSYTVCLKVTNLAGTDSVCKSVVISGINEVDASAQISVFPNPTNNVINILLNDELKGNAQLDILNPIGEVVLSRKASGNSVEKFNMDKLPQGVYFVRISGEGVKAIKKFVYAK